MISVRASFEKMFSSWRSSGENRRSAASAPPPTSLQSRGYSEIRNIGRGAFGYASLVVREETNEYYVTKFLKYKHFVRKEKERVLREVKTMMHLSKDGGNPYLVRFRESFVVSASGELCIVMDFCNGGDLACAISAQRARGGAFDEERVLLWLLQTLSAMDFLHCHNVLHRDIKPANVFLHRGVCKLGDMGLSKLVGDAVSIVQHTQCGSPLYLAPEVHMGQKYSAQIDMWALGCTLFEMMMLSHAFVGREQAEILQNIVWARHAAIVGSWTPELVAILEAMLSLKPEKRPGYTDIVNNPLFAHLIQSGKLHPRALRHRVARADRVVRGRADASMESMEVVQVQHLDLHRAISASDFTDDL